MSNDTAVRLAEIPNIVGIKDATGDVPRGKALIDALNGKMAVYSGDDETAWDLCFLAQMVISRLLQTLHLRQ